MKTSNILIITYLSMIFAGLAVLYFDSMRRFAKHRDEAQTNVQLYESKVDLPQFTVIVDTTGYSFSVTSGENNQFVIVDDKATEISSEICNVRNDTLFINCSPRYGLTIVCKEVKAIIVKNAEWLYITDLSSEALYLKLEKVHSAINNLKVGTFNFDVSNETRCDANNIEVETLTGKLSNSRFNIYSSKIRRSSIEQLDEKNQNMIIY